MRIWTEDARGTAFWLVLGMALAGALLLALPGQTVTAKYVNDLLIFMDGAHRIDVGQVPNRDFHTALGPLNFYLPAIGYWLSGSLGAAMPWGMALLTLLVAPALAHVLVSRMRPAIALPYAAFLILVLLIPANIGDAITDLSFAMFYNRIGWAALGALLAMHLRPTRPTRLQPILDGLSAALFTLVLVYTKASYGAVALAFLTLMLLDSVQRRWVLLALALTLGIGLGIEAVWRSSAAHLQDLLLAGRVSGAMKEPLDFLGYVLRHLADLTLLGLIAGLALWRTRSFRNVLFFGFCIGAGLLILGQNYQNWGILTLQAGAAVAAESLARRLEPDSDSRSWAPGAAAPLLFVALVLPTMVHCAATLALHAGAAIARAGEATGLPRLNDIRLARFWTGNHQDHASNARYLETLREGARILQEFEPPASHVFVLDFVTPFSAALGLQPPRGDSAWLHWGRTLDENNLIPPEEMLRDVRIVLEPKVAIEGVTADNLRVGYGRYLDTHYVLVRDSTDWKVYVNRAWLPARVEGSAEASARR